MNRNPSRLALLVAGHGAVVLGSFRLGVRALVYGESIPLEGHDFVQTSASPFLRVDFGRAWLRIAGTLNLDAPFGHADAASANVTWYLRVASS